MQQMNTEKFTGMSVIPISLIQPRGSIVSPPPALTGQRLMLKEWSLSRGQTPNFNDNLGYLLPFYIQVPAGCLLHIMLTSNDDFSDIGNGEIICYPLGKSAVVYSPSLVEWSDDTTEAWFSGDVYCTEPMVAWCINEDEEPKTNWRTKYCPVGEAISSDSAELDYTGLVRWTIYKMKEDYLV